jgi:3-methylcrotonyl-CoA carboxylase beta subunit
MGGPQAASVLLTVKMDADKGKNGTFDAAAQEAFKAPILAKYDSEGHPYYSTARLWDDGIIDPIDTRRVLAIGLRAARYAPQPSTHHNNGLFRM